MDCAATDDLDQVLDDLRLPDQMKSIENNQERVLRPVKPRVDFRALANKVHMVHNDRVVHNPEPRAGDRKYQKGHILQLGPNVDKELPKIERQVGDVVQQHDRKTDNRTLQHDAARNFADRDDVVDQNHQRFARRVHEPNVNSVVDEDEHVIELLKERQLESIWILPEHIAAILRPDEALAVRAARERHHADHGADDIMDHIKRSVCEFVEPLHLEGPPESLQDIVHHE